MATNSNPWDPIPSPQRKAAQLDSSLPEFIKSSIRLDDPSSYPIPAGTRLEKGVSSKGVVLFESDSDTHEVTSNLANHNSDDKDHGNAAKAANSSVLSFADYEEEDLPPNPSSSAKPSIPQWLQEEIDSDEDRGDRQMLAAQASCCGSESVSSQKREWKEKREEIEQKRIRLDSETHQEEEENVEGSLPGIE